MNEQNSPGLSRRDLLKNTGTIAAASTLSSLILPRAYAAQESATHIALVGCGGRGSGAAVNALENTSGPTRLVAMADVFEEKLNNSYEGIKAKYDNQVDVPEDRRFLGFDAYKHAMDALRPGDVVILTTPVAFRWVHYTYAIEKGLNVFMEKPISTDGPTTRRMLELNNKAKAKNLKVGVGLMCRHCQARGELFDRIQDGAIGEQILLRAYRVVGPTASAFSERNPGKLSDLMYQIRRFHSFLWLSGGAFSDFLIHNIDECCWMKNAWPVEAKGFGGRHYRNDFIDQNFDTYTVEYTYDDGTKLMLEGRCMTGCYNEFASYTHGTKGSAVISTSSHIPAKSRIYKGQRMDKKDDLVWEFGRREPNPYQLEWNDLIAAIRNDAPYNEVDRGAMAALVTSMGRFSCHTGQKVTLDQMMNQESEFAPHVDELTVNSDSPLMPKPDGSYPVPMPGIVKDREYDPNR